MFYPLGLNHFVKKPLGELLKLHYGVFTEYGDTFSLFLSSLFSLKSLEEKREQLDRYFLNRLDTSIDQRLVHGVNILRNASENITTDKLAKMVGASRRTLLRLFKKHLGYTIEDYKSVIKFRRALLHFQSQREGFRLTDIAYQSIYYDQPDFNRQVRARSGLTPSELFRQLDIVDDILFWNLSQ